MVARLARLVLALAGVSLLAGIGGFLLAAGAYGWEDLAEGVAYYGSRVHRDQPLLLPLSLTTLGIVIALLGVTLHRRSSFERTRAARHRAGVARVELRDLNRGLDEARRQLDRELTRSRRDPERALEALLSTLTELETGVTGLSLEPDASGMTIEVTAELRGRGDRQPIVSTTESVLRRVVDRLAEMLHASGETIRGELEFRKATRSELIRVEASRAERGLRLSLRPAPDLTGPGRPRVTFMARPDRTPIPERRSEHSQPFSVDDSTDRLSGLVLGLDPSGEREVSPVVASRERRPVVGVEAAIRLLAALALAGCVSLVASRALEWGWRRARTGEQSAPWREVVVRIESYPPAAEVTIDGRVRGQTPLVVRELCKRRPLSVLVGAPAHRTWNWRGICPGQGPLLLDARLQPLPR